MDTLNITKYVGKRNELYSWSILLYLIFHHYHMVLVPMLAPCSVLPHHLTCFGLMVDIGLFGDEQLDHLGVSFPAGQSERRVVIAARGNIDLSFVLQQQTGSFKVTLSVTQQHRFSNSIPPIIRMYSYVCYIYCKYVHMLLISTYTVSMYIRIYVCSWTVQ